MDLTDLNGLDLKKVLTQAKDQNANPFEHDDLTKRIRRTLYYDPIKRPDMDTLSFSITKSAVSCFRNAAPMPMRKLGHRYASQVARDACISPCALLLGLIYIERLKHKNPSYLEKVTSSDLFLVSMMVASKYLYDEGSEDEVFNDEWAISGDMEVEKVNKLEADFLGAIDWHLYVHPHEFSSMLNVAETDIALSNGCKRGWMTYSDLRSLLDCHSVYKQLYQTAGILSKATCLCMIMYSGLVCLAAFSSAALVSVTQLATCGGAVMGPQLPQNRSSVDDAAPDSHDTDDVAGISIQEEVAELLQSPEPDFISSLPPIPASRLEIVTQPPDIPDRAPEITNTSQTAHGPSPPSTTDPPDDSRPPPTAPKRNQPSTIPLVTILEAVIFMAHVPGICPKTVERKEVCTMPPAPENETIHEDGCAACHRKRDAVHRPAHPRLSCDLHARYDCITKHRKRGPIHPSHVISALHGLKLSLNPPARKPPFRLPQVNRIATVVH